MRKLTMLKKTFRAMIALMLFTAFSNQTLAQYVVDFEGSGEESSSYPAATINLSGLNWQVGPQVQIGTAANDFKNGNRSARFRAHDGSVLEQIQDKDNGIGTVSFVYRRYGSDSDQQPWAVEYSDDGGTNWTQIGSNFTATETVQTFQETVNAEGNVRLRIRLVTTPGTSGDRRMNVDDITITDYIAGAPVLTASAASLNGFTYTEGNGPSAAQTVTVTGQNLIGTGNIELQSTSGFELSTDDISYFTTIQLPYDAEEITGSGEVYVRLAAGLNPGVYSGSISVSGGSATALTINTNGFVSPSLYPQPHSLASGTYSFTEWDASSPVYTYPSNMRFWTSVTDLVALDQQPEGVYTGAYNLSSASRINGIDQDGVSFVATGSVGAGYPLGAVLGINTLGRENIEVSWTGGLIAQGAGLPTPRAYGLRLQYQVGQSATWTDVPGPIEYLSAGKTNGDEEAFSPVILPTECNDETEIYLRWIYHFIAANDGGSRPDIRLDEILIDSDAIVYTPEIVSSVTNLNPFTQTLGTPSAEQNFTVSGTHLTSDITLTAPAEYEISLTSGSGFASTLNLAQTAGTVATTTIYVRLNASSVGTHAGDIAVESTGAATVNIAVTGTTNALPTPAIIASVSSLSAFSQTEGTPSAEQNFTVSGTDLTNDITLTAPAEYEISLTSGSGFASTLNLTQTAGEVATTTIYVRLNASSVGTHTGNIEIESAGATTINVAVTGETVALPTPTIVSSATSLSAFSQTEGTPSAEQNFTVSGTDLTNDITLTAPAEYEISLTSGSGFASTLNLTQTAGEVATTTIYVRLNASSVGTHAGNIEIESAGATTINVAVTGETVAAPINDGLLYYWHFNNMPSGPDVTEIIADYSYLPVFDGKFTYTDPISGERDIDRYSEGSSLNLQQGEGEGYSARVRNPSTTRSLVFDVPTTGAEGIQFEYAVQRSGQGMLHNIVEYSVDGVNFISTGLSNNSQEVVGAETWQLFTFDFTSITAVNNNPDFKIKITWDGNTTASNGNNRYDNITLTAESVDPNVSVSSISGKSDLKLYPTPFEENISISSSSNIKTIQVIDLLGKVVKTVAGNNTATQQVSMADLNSGTYIFMIETTEGTSQIKSVKK